MADAEPTVSALRRLGCTVRSLAVGQVLDGDGSADQVTLVLTDDYLRPELQKLDAALRGVGRPWLLVKPVGAYLERVFERRQTPLDSFLVPFERLIHRIVGIDPEREMDWKRYSLAFGIFGLVNVVLLYLALRWQTWFCRQQMLMKKRELLPTPAATFKF